MIVDTSAIVAILRDEPEALGFVDRILLAGGAALSAGSWVELEAVATRSGDERIKQNTVPLLANLGIAVAPVTIEQAEIAREAYRRYGLGTGHPAKLNFGDCFPYALAKSTGEPLLFKGADFAQTDVTRALPA